MIISTGFVTVVVTNPVSIEACRCVSKSSSLPLENRFTNRFASSYAAHCEAVRIADRVTLMDEPAHSPFTPRS